jgi:hypothetical protein
MNYPKLRDNIKKEWLAALRTGGYKQGKSRLLSTSVLTGGENEDRFCCLGVMCDLEVRRGLADWEPQEGFSGSKIRQYSTPYADGVRNAIAMTGRPPHNMASEWFKSGAITYEGVVTQLIKMNDKQGKTFKQIAAWINKNL